MSIRRAAVAIGLLALVTSGGLVGCGKKDDFEDHTAIVTIGGKATTYQLDSCGRDHETVFVVGRAKDGSVLQAVVGTKKDHKTGVLDSTGLSIIHDPDSVSAFGKESWARRGQSGTAPGTITSARIRGSRIQVSTLAQPVDADESPTAADPITTTLDARCDAQDQ